MPRRFPVSVGIAALLTMTVGLATRPFGCSAIGRRKQELSTQRSVPVVVAIEGSGDLRVPTESGEPTRLLGHVGGTQEEAATALDMLSRQIAASLARTPTVEIRAGRELPWFRVAWVLGALASSASPDLEFRFRLTQGAEPAVDRAYMSSRGFAIIDVGQETIPVLVAQFLDPGVPPESQLLSAFRLRVTVTSVPIDEEPHAQGLLDESLPWRTAWTERSLAHQVALDVLRETRGIEACVLYASPPLRRRISFGDVLSVLRGVRGADAAPFLLGGLAVDSPQR